jgi:predicted  nucleic acid-binding Zn-ribbon protein
MTQAEALYQLQEIDLRLARAQKRLQEISALLGDNQAVMKAQAQVSQAQQRLAPLQTSVRNLELEIQSNKQKIQVTDEQLYSGRVKNPKELQDMQQEIQSLKKRNEELEDHLLETMIAVEEAEAALAGATSQLQQVREAWESEHGQMLDEGAQLESQIAALRQQREQALKSVEPEYQKLYQNLRAKKHNQPIAVLSGNSCGVCGVEQTLAIVKSVRQGQELVYCMSCGRILVGRGS